jgi:cytochrome P450
MMVHPELQTYAQDEIDSITSQARLPTLADRKDLPFTDAITKEVIRLSSIVPQGGFRELDVDDVYEGYLLPRGSFVFANIWYGLPYAFPFLRSGVDPMN